MSKKNRKYFDDADFDDVAKDIAGFMLLEESTLTPEETKCLQQAIGIIMHRGSELEE